MKSMEITAVGIDVSKRKSTVAIRRPGGVIVACPFDISHSSHDLEKLVSILKTTGGDIRVVMEHTSNYWKPIALTLKNAGFYVSVVNAMLIHDFSDNSIRKLKTDRADSLKIANYALTFWNQLPPFNDEDETRLVLKEQSRMYERLASTATSLRNGLIALADQTFPSIDQAFGHAIKNADGHEKWVDFFSIYRRSYGLCRSCGRLQTGLRLAHPMINKGGGFPFCGKLPPFFCVCIKRKAPYFLRSTVLFWWRLPGRF